MADKNPAAVDVAAAAQRNKAVASKAVTAALELARAARKSQSNPKLKAVRVEDPDTFAGELTQKFEALKPA